VNDTLKTVKTEISLNCVWRFNSYRAVQTLFSVTKRKKNKIHAVEIRLHHIKAFFEGGT